MLHDNINKYKKITGFTNIDLANKTGVTISTLDKLTSGTNDNPKLSTLKVLADAFNCKLDDLIFGDNAKNSAQNEYTINNNLVIKYENLDSYGKKAVDNLVEIEYQRCLESKTSINCNYSEPTTQIKISEYKVSAGVGYHLDDGDCWSYIEVTDTPEVRKADFGLQIKGDSMEPVYHDGDIVLVKESPCVDKGEIGIYVLNNEGFIKKNGGDRLISLNSEYNDIVIKEYDDIRCVGKVIGRV